MHQVNRTVAERLYYQTEVAPSGPSEESSLEFQAVVTDIRLVARGRAAATGVEGGAAVPLAQMQLWQVALDRTAFYPEGGGQPWDTGVLIATARSGAVLEVPVERVTQDAEGEVWHYISKPLVEGTAVVGRVHAERRQDHTQQHTGQHLLSAVFLRELGARTVSFHLSAYTADDSMVQPATIDVGDVDSLSQDDLRRVETAANRLIYEDRMVHSRWVSRSQAEAMLERGDLRKLPEFQDYRAGAAVRVVEIDGIEHNACGGTHVRSTGAIGAVMVRRIERVKLGWRVEFCCGQRAVRMAAADFTRLAAASAALSTGMADVPGRVRSLLDEVRTGAKQRKAMLEDLARAEAAALVAGVAESGVAQAVFAGKDLEFVKRVAVRIAEQGRAAVVGATGTPDAAIAVARRADSSAHCGNLLREALSQVGGRGGGPAEMAQGTCPADQFEPLMKRFVELLGT